jgi:predicted DNA-binding transcriptional regulator AlpA
MSNDSDKVLASIRVELASYRKQSERLNSLIEDCERRIRDAKSIAPVRAAAPQGQRMLLPEHEVRQSIGVSRSTWWRLLRDNAAPEHVKIGERRFYRPEALASWLESHKG